MSFSFVPYGLVGRLSAVVPAFVSLAPLVVSLAFVCTPGSASAAAGPYGYFSLAPDPRLCPSPACGGWWLAAVNQSTTTCLDGSQQAACYVASADFGALKAPPTFGSGFGSLIVRGRIEAYEEPVFGELGRLVAESAWTGATPQSVQGVVYRVRDLGIVCVTHPCYSLESRVLNQTDSRLISELDLSAIDATPDQLAAAEVALQRGDLIVRGTTGPDPGPAGEGLALHATQLFLPEPARPRCQSDAECVSGTLCNAAEICLPLPECEPGDPCPTVCSGYCSDVPEPETALMVASGLLGLAALSRGRRARS